MRVIAGKCRSLPLKTIPGLDTRPTTDRTKETLFNVLQPWIPGGEFLDCFSGSGAIGIEALSRGAKRAVFVERSKKACACIHDNLSFCRLTADAEVIQTDVAACLSRMGSQQSFDCIFMDPPYGQGLEREALTLISANRLLKPDGILCVEESREHDLSYVEALGFAIYKEKLYKTNKHVFLRLYSEENP